MTRSSAGSDLLQAAPLTIVLIAANVLVYFLQSSTSDTVVELHSNTTGGATAVQGSIDGHYALWGPMVSSGEFWRLVSNGFLHASVLHLGMNMLSLFFLGRLMEPLLGPLRLGMIYFVALAAGSLGVIVVEPDALTLGASGAIFGLAGALLVIANSRGVSFMQSGIGPVVLLNLAITFTIPGISIGGHIGGLAGGAAIAAIMVEGERRRIFRRGNSAPLIATAATAFVVLLLVAFAIARSKYPSLS